MSSEIAMNTLNPLPTTSGETPRYEGSRADVSAAEFKPVLVYSYDPTTRSQSEDSFLGNLQEEEDEDDDLPRSSVTDASINLIKLCLGSGVLALPYAVNKGGLILSPIFIGLVAWWNYVSCEQMMDCKRAAACSYVPSQVSSSYSRIAYCACGWIGVRMTDLCIIITLLGVCITYLITFSSLLLSVPGMNLSPEWTAVMGMAIVFPFAMQRDVSKLAKMSILGLVCVLIGIASISFFGVALYGDEAMDEPRMLPLWCPSVSDFATFVGIAVFGFGTCSLAFPVEETMKVPLDFSIAAKYSLIFVWVVYVFVGNGIASLFIHDARGINSNILRNLPTDALSAHIVKIALAGSCLLTLPLAFIPPAQMIEQKLMHIFESARNSDTSSINSSISNSTAAAHPYKEIHAAAATGERTPISQSPTYIVSRSGSPQRRPNYNRNDEEDIEAEYPLYKQEPSFFLRVVNRVVLMVIITVGSLAIPCFGLMVSFLGSFTVAILSFVLPPLFSMLIITKHKKDNSSADKWNYIRDVVLMTVGIFTAVSATTIVALKCIETMTSGEGEC